MPITPDPPFPKEKGQPLRSKDWNQLVVEVQRLDTAKVNKNIADTLTGPLIIQGSLRTNDLNAGSFNLPAATGRLAVTGPAAELGFVRRTLTAWPATPAAGDRFLWYNPDGNARLFTEQRGDLLTVTNTGNVGLGIFPAFKLDVHGRMRVRQISSGDATAGIWFSSYYRQELDAAFVGMANQNQVGFWGNRVGSASWKLLVDTGNGNLSITGNAFKPGGGAWGVSSDARLKKNIEPLTGALEKLLQLRGVVYEWKEPEKQGNLTGPQVGLIAQEVEAVFPEWVDVDLNGYRTLTVRGFEALAIEAFKQLKADNKALQKRCEALEARLKLLEDRLQVTA